MLTIVYLCNYNDVIFILQLFYSLFNYRSFLYPFCMLGITSVASPALRNWGTMLRRCVVTQIKVIRSFTTVALSLSYSLPMFTVLRKFTILMTMVLEAWILRCLPLFFPEIDSSKAMTYVTLSFFVFFFSFALSKENIPTSCQVQCVGHCRRCPGSCQVKP